MKRKFDETKIEHDKRVYVKVNHKNKELRKKYRVDFNKEWYLGH